MAKTIKFNLILDGYSVRNIEGLQEHFSIEDMLRYFENGLLARWLRVRGYDKELAEVEAIEKASTQKEIIMALIKVFDVADIDEPNVDYAIGILKYLEEEKVLNETYKENYFAKKQIIDDYHSGYEALILHMEENNENMALLKADVEKMERDYLELFKLDYYRLYYHFLESAQKVIFLMLSRPSFGNFWTDNSTISMELQGILSNKKKIKKMLGDDLKVVKKNTEGVWDPIEREDVKVMVIRITQGSFVKNAVGDYFEKVNASDIKENPMLFNGLDYKSSTDDAELLYMEV